jgi:hypothetical protein
LPWDSFYAATQAEGANRNGDRLLDVNMFIGWSSPVGFAIETGYRRYRLELVDYDQPIISIDLRGPYATIYLHF